MAFKHILLLLSAKSVMMVRVGHNPISPHSEHSAVLPLTPHTKSNRRTCQKEKCMINRLWHGNFHIIPHINPRHLYQPKGRGSEGWYGCLGLIWGMIWKSPYNNVYVCFPIIDAYTECRGLYYWAKYLVKFQNLQPISPVLNISIL